MKFSKISLETDKRHMHNQLIANINKIYLI